ncbi:MAG: hypothetical protein HWQ35_12355 [Nostoc sp. NMS1]|uniref:hypothetical protein n=1 Tax=Nostoc sp. NMS1 TaxID=2815388 RepID=UPI0025E6A80E|nr:hypothetical protein [Nostoc sp. NMS1]MBN3907318.1 hypothetical protein [Nostoc sp. NMS1]
MSACFKCEPNYRSNHTCDGGGNGAVEAIFTDFPKFAGAAYGFLATFGDLGWGRQRAEGRRQKEGKKEGGRDTIELLTSNFTPSNFWYGIAIPPVT